MKCTLLLPLFLLFFNNSYAQPAWQQVGIELGEAAGDNLGTSVSLSADGLTLAVGAPNNDGGGLNTGSVQVFSLIAGIWTKRGGDIDGEAAGDLFGTSVSISDNGLIVAIGAPNNDGGGIDAGHVRVYRFINSVWTQQGIDINGEAVGDQFGRSVSLSADGLTVAVGGPNNGGNGAFSGHTRVYKNITGVWTQQGGDIDGEAANDFSGYAVGLSSDGLTVAVGAYENDGTASNAGHVRVFSLVGNTWTQQGADIDGEASGDFLGKAVSLSSDGLTVAAGAPNNDGSGFNAGHARVYKLIAGTWTKQGADIDGEGAGDQSGTSVSLSGDGLTLAIGAPKNAFFAGHARVYQLAGSVWTQQGMDIDGSTGGDQLGTSVSLSRDSMAVAIGAPNHAGNGTDAGQVLLYKYNNSTSIFEPTFGENIRLFPNPTSSNVTIDLEDALVDRISICDITGKEVYASSTIFSSVVNISLAYLEKSVYIVRVQAKQQERVFKLVKQ